ncbi:hypothetical protein PWE30_06335 [Shigella dysenteriae]|uniref:hypothetical protein n=2 Tax=Shigella dysenteriae TaxID=622 RepID=UPI0010080D3D|nr:hypothetical protein [Shigella dysenteriae]WNT69690.1 hypothetical protein PWE30_06335 [Shigella dysenteriae]
MRAEIALMSGSAFAVTHHAFGSGAGRTSDGNGSHASTLKSPSYTKSVSWQHYLVFVLNCLRSISFLKFNISSQNNVTLLPFILSSKLICCVDNNSIFAAIASLTEVA